MEIRFNVTGEDRKRLVTAIGEISGIKPLYLKVPSCAYQIGEIIVDKNGTVTGADESLKCSLAEKGFEGNEITCLTIEIPKEGFNEISLENLKRIIASKQILIKKALDVESIDFEIKDDHICFPWFNTSENAKAYTLFISALCSMAKTHKCTINTEKLVANEKYTFRCFLLRLGFIGEEYKAERKILLQNLTGSSAFKEVFTNENTK